MKKNWQPEELVEHWTLLPDELELLRNKNEPNRLGFALLFKFFQYYARFPENLQEIPTVVVNYVAKVINVSPEKYREYDWQGRLIKYHRAQIRKFFGFREATVLDAEDLTNWLASLALVYELKFEHLREAAISRLRELKIEPPTPERLERIIRSAIRLEEERFFSSISSQLSQETKAGIDKLLQAKTTQVTTENNESQTNSTLEEVSSLSELKSDPGRIGVESFLQEINKLATLRSLELPLDLFKKIPTKVLQIYFQRVVAEQPWDLRRHPEAIRYTIVSAFCYLRSLDVTDNLVELVIQIVHRIGARAEKRVDKELLNDFKKVTGKNQILFQIASASINQPSGVIKDVIFPVVSEETLKNLVKEYKSTGNAYREKVYTVMRSSYGGHYRRILPLILSQLEFRSNNEIHRPVIRAIELLKKYADRKQRYYDVGEDIPIEGLLRSGWQELILEQSDDGEVKVNRINYELSVLQALRDKLRCKEIWVVGANRYRNPEEDLPTDFEAQREVYFSALKQPNDVELFISNLQQQMRDALAMLDEGLPKNKSVEIRQRKNKKSWIKVSPLLAEPEPINLVRLKAEITHRWPTTSLLDILKETDLRVGFSEHFKSASQREILDRAVLQKRLLLCLYGLGTNTGLKRLSSAVSGEHYHDLLYVKRRFIQKEQLRNAIASVANAIFQARLSSIWGEGTTACASDSKKFGAWDQNLMTEWHIRYGGRGVMIYWHVEKNSVCIYSQLKTCS